MRRTQIHLDEQQTNRLEDREEGAWRAQWREAVHRSAGIAPGLTGGETYVEDIRAGDAARLTRLKPCR